MAGEVAKPHDHLFRSVFRDEAEAAALLRANLPQPITNALIWSTLKRRDRSFIDSWLRDTWQRRRRRRLRSAGTDSRRRYGATCREEKK